MTEAAGAYGITFHLREDRRHIQDSDVDILKKRGILLSYDPNRSNPFMWLCRARQSLFYSAKGITENERLLSAEEIGEALACSGFLERKVYSISGILYKYINNRFSFLMLPVYNFCERIIDLIPLRYKFGSFLITFARK